MMQDDNVILKQALAKLAVVKNSTNPKANTNLNQVGVKLLFDYVETKLEIEYYRERDGF